MRMTPTQITCLARLVSDLRAEWDFHGTKAAVEKLADTESAFTVCQMAIAAAADPTAITPAAMSNPVYRQPSTSPASGANPVGGRDPALERFLAEMRGIEPCSTERVAEIRAAAGYPRKVA